MLPAVHTWTLTAISIVAGVAMLWAFGRFSDQDRIELAKRKLRAHLYAFRLFADEPALIFRAQKKLLIWNARYLGLMLRPTVVILVPMALLLIQLEAIYSRRPLVAGESAIVTAQMDDRVDLQTVSPLLEGRGIAVETQAVRIPDEHQASWRVRATGPASGSVVLHVPGAAAVKSVQAGSGFRYIAERRASSLSGWLLHPGEGRLPGGAVEWIEVSYPSADIGVFGYGVNWLVWFFVVSGITMLVLKKRFGVTF